MTEMRSVSKDLQSLWSELTAMKNEQISEKWKNCSYVLNKWCRAEVDLDTRDEWNAEVHGVDLANIDLITQIRLVETCQSGRRSSAITMVEGSLLARKGKCLAKTPELSPLNITANVGVLKQWKRVENKEEAQKIFDQSTENHRNLDHVSRATLLPWKWYPSTLLRDVEPACRARVLALQGTARITTPPRAGCVS